MSTTPYLIQQVLTSASLTSSDYLHISWIGAGFQTSSIVALIRKNASGHMNGLKKRMMAT